MTYPCTSAEHHYVALRDRGQVACIMGPFASKGEAAVMVEPMRRALLPRLQGTDWFAEIGVARCEVKGGGTPPDGAYNGLALFVPLGPPGSLTAVISGGAPVGVPGPGPPPSAGRPVRSGPGAPEGPACRRSHPRSHPRNHPRNGGLADG